MGRKTARRNLPASRGKLDLAEALFTATQRKVLRLLFVHPDRSFFASELISLAESGSGAVQREVARLVDSGLVNQRLIGRQRHYQVNSESPIFEELRSIVVKTSGIPEVIGEALRPLSSRIALAFVYGSVAKGAATSTSDIDVLVVGDEVFLEDLYSSFEKAEKRLGRKINPTLYSTAEFRRRRDARNPFLSKLLGGEKVVVCGSLNAI